MPRIASRDQSPSPTCSNALAKASGFLVSITAPLRPSLTRFFNPGYVVATTGVPIASDSTTVRPMFPIFSDTFTLTSAK